MQEIRSLNYPVVTGICDPNKYWARHHRNDCDYWHKLVKSYLHQISKPKLLTQGRQRLQWYSSGSHFLILFLKMWIFLAFLIPDWNMFNIIEAKERLMLTKRLAKSRCDLKLYVSVLVCNISFIIVFERFSL